ncbi:hypothetical protein Tco_0360208 [Tanacetum coccineum]
MKWQTTTNIKANKEGICLSQRKYCLELLHEYGLLATKHVDTPLLENTTLNHIETDDHHLLDSIGNYQKLYMHAPLVSYLNDALRVLRYLKGSPRSGIQINKSVKEQSTLSRSSAEAEYRSMASATCEVIWLSNLLSDMGVKDLLPVVMYCDNSSALQIAANPIADVLTKALDIEQHKSFCVKLGMLNMFKVEKLEGGLRRYAMFVARHIWIPLGEHAVHCKELQGFKYRHDIVRDVLFDMCRRVGISSKKESPMNFLTYLSDERSTLRPADVDGLEGNMCAWI